MEELYSNDWAAEEAAKELGLPPEQVKLVASHLWKAVRYYLSHPHLVRAGIYLPQFLRIRPMMRKMESFVKRAMFGQSELAADDPTVLYFKQVLKNKYDKYSKYDTKSKRTPAAADERRQRAEKHFRGGRGYVKTEEGSFDLLSWREIVNRSKREGLPREIE